MDLLNWKNKIVPAPLLSTSIQSSQATPIGKIGFLLPTFFPTYREISLGEDIATFSKLAEQTGASALWVLDHSLWSIPTLDSIGALFCAAATTKSIALGTSVLQLPLRSQIIVAKQMATLGAIYGRTPILGVGIGNYKLEYEKLGCDFELRTEKFISQLESLIELRGRNFKPESEIINGVDKYQLTPAFKSPIWIGGRSTRSLKWTALYGDGWLPHFLSQARYLSLVSELDELAEKSGRSITEIKKGIVIFGNIAKSVSDIDESVSWVSNITGIHREKIEKYVFTGSPNQFSDFVMSWLDLGIDHLIIGISSNTPLRTVEVLMDKILKSDA